MSAIQKAQSSSSKDGGNALPKRKRKSRAILANVPTNIASNATHVKSYATKKEEAPRRCSERLSNPREDPTATNLCVAVVPLDNMKAQHLEAKRKRSKTLPERPGKRVRIPPSTTSILVQATSRRLDSEFENFSQAPKCSKLKRDQLVDKSALQQEHHNLSLTNFEPTKYTTGFSPFDITNRGDVLHSPEYVSDIFQRLYQSETITAPTCYMHRQQCISPLMRSILVDWIVDIHLQFQCAPETLHLAINIIDRYLTNVEITRDIVQLVGITALLLASKYEDVSPPEVKNCVMICEPSYTIQQVLDMEVDMLRELSYNLTIPTGYPFLQRFLFITRASETMAIAANYYAERMLQEHDALKFRPSVIAAASVCLAINHPEIRTFDSIEASKPGVPQELLDYTGYSQELIMDAANFVAKKVDKVVKTKANRSLMAVYRKYGSRRYRHVSLHFESPDAVDILADMD